LLVDFITIKRQTQVINSLQISYPEYCSLKPAQDSFGVKGAAVGAVDFCRFLAQYQFDAFIKLGQVHRGDFKLDVVADNQAQVVHPILGR
jgi:hypothetical protein